MANRNAKTKRAISPARQKARADLSKALLHAAAIHGLSEEQAARDIDTDARTVRRWLAGEVRMDVELVSIAPIIGRTFKRMWCSEGHDVAPYLARKRAKRSV